MQQLSRNSSLESAEIQASALSVVIVYEDFEAGKHAKRTYDYLVDALGAETQFTNTMWKFDVLMIPKLREIAAKDAAMADVVIIASHGGGQLPRHVQAWADQWVAFRGNTMAVVSLCDCSPEEAEPVRTYLESIASRAKLEFFSQPGEGLHRVSWGPIVQSPSKRQVRAFDTLSGAMKREINIPRWGINE